MQKSEVGRFRYLLTFTGLFMLVLALACGGKLIASQPFVNGELTWTTTAPAEGEVTLWLSYSVDAPAETSQLGTEEEQENALASISLIPAAHAKKSSSKKSSSKSSSSKKSSSKKKKKKKKSSKTTGADYEFEGTLLVKVDGKVLYDGELELDEDDPPLENSSTNIRTGKSSSCTSTRCKESGTLKLLELDGAKPGAKIEVKAKLPLEEDDAKITSLEMQLRG